MYFSKVGLKIMEFYFQHPSSEEYVKNLAKVLKVGAGSVSTTCSLLGRQGFLLRKEKSNSLFYSLNDENPLVKKLKSLWVLEKFLSLKKKWLDPAFISVALFGSCASGNFDRKSDADVLVITNLPDSLVYEKFRKVDFRLPMGVIPVVFSVSKWMDLAKRKDRFYIEVISNHILLEGSSIVVG